MYSLAFNIAFVCRFQMCGFNRSDSMQDDLCEYEKKRLKAVEENNAVIQQLFDEVSSTQASVLKYSKKIRMV